MAAVSYIRFRAKGNPQFYYVLPPDAEVRKHLADGKGSITRSLGTRDQFDMNRLALEWAADIKSKIVAIRNGTYRTTDDQTLDLFVSEWVRSEVAGGEARYGLQPPFQDEDEITQSVDAWLAGEGRELSADLRTNLIEKAVHRYRRHEERETEKAHAIEQYRRDLGNSVDPSPIAIPPAPKPPMVVHDDLMSDAVKPISFHQRKFMLTKAGKGKGTINSYEVTFRRFIALHGDVAIHSVTTRQAESFYQHLLTVKSDKRDGKTLDFDTINRSISNLRQFFKWAVSRHLISDDPMRKLIVDKPDDDGDEEGKEPYSLEDMRLIAGALPDEAEHKRWYALVAMHTGMRLSEIGQLEPEDIIDLNGRKHFSVNRKSAHGHKKTTKTKSSIRQIPIHPALIELGFLDWAEKRSKVSRDGRIWPEYRYGRWWNEKFAPAAGVKTPSKTFHSWRHAFRDVLKAATPNAETIDRIMGHFREGTGALYGGRDLLAHESAVIDAVKFAGLDLSHVMK